MTTNEPPSDLPPAPPPPPATPAAPALPAPVPSPAEYYVVTTPHEVARWRPLVNWMLYIPHGMVLYGLAILAGIVGMIYWLKFLFTGKFDRDLYSVMAMYERYNTRASAFLMGFTEEYPPFNFPAGGDDNEVYSGITLNLPEPPETAPRKLALNFLLAIPHYFVLAIFGIGAAVVAILAWFAVLFTGRWPEGMRRFLIRFGNYYFRVYAYAVMVEADYPKFGLSGD